MKRAIFHPGRLLNRELTTRKLSANRLSLDIGVPSGRITDILNGRRSITADTAVRLGRCFGNSAQFWLELRNQYDIAVVEREKGGEIAILVQRADVAWLLGRVGRRRYPAASRMNGGLRCLIRPTSYCRALASLSHLQKYAPSRSVMRALRRLGNIV